MGNDSIYHLNKNPFRILKGCKWVTNFYFLSEIFPLFKIFSKILSVIK